MAVKDFAQALKYTNARLQEWDKDRYWVQDFWINQTPRGMAYRDAEHELADPGAVDDDRFFIFEVVCDVQEFVFGDEGDEALGVDVQHATAEEVDGKMGPLTFQRMLAWLDFANDDIIEDVLVDRVPDMVPNDYLVFNGERIPVPGVEIVSFDEPGGLDLARDARKKWKRDKGFTSWPKDILELAGKHSKYARLLGFLHWDAGWSAEGAFNALVRRGLGTCVGVDRPRKSDGRVVCYQWLDPGKFYGWHGSSANPRSVISFDLSNAVYLKYHAKYTSLCGIERPKLFISGQEKVGSGSGFLGMYRDQIVSTLRILNAVSGVTGQPLVFPVRSDGRALGRNYKRLFKDDFHGVATHRHLPSTTKWDIRGFEAQIAALLLTEPDLMREFPSLVESFRLHDDWRGPWLDQVKAAWEWKELWS